MTQIATLMAGVPVTNTTLYHQIRFLVGDSAALIRFQETDGSEQSLLLVRDIEVGRAKQVARADTFGCAADYCPESGLSGDRDTALAQAVAECLGQKGVARVVADRTLPFIFAHHIQQRGLTLDYDGELGVMARRIKDEDEIQMLLKAQKMTHDAMKMACEMIARADADAEGVLHHGGEVLTSERVRRQITRYLMDQDFSNPHDSIVATVPHVADCHHKGTGPLKTGAPVIVDIFPCDEETRYWGDCTRTVVHGDVTDEVARMHSAVKAAKDAGTNALQPGVTGEQVHAAVTEQILAHGYQMSRGATPEDPESPAMRHGTGHGIGLDVHEPILLDDGAGEILEREVFTVEPGLYSQTHGGVRIEDMVVVRETGPEILGELHEGLNWD